MTGRRRAAPARKLALRRSGPEVSADFSYSDSDRCAELLMAVADTDRLQIIRCLQRGPRNVSELAAALGNSLPNVSHHLGILRKAGLVSTHKEGKFVTYALSSEYFP